eukprot:GEMP01010024.1.p1 GENE.GEMP01010024.1~~GEMP01010024.1.p1  ORF type:complete len:727 (+),score=198.02 GEMP01010024.1:153-2333(+)
MSAKMLSQAILINRQLSGAKTVDDVLSIWAKYSRLANTVNHVTALEQLRKFRLGRPPKNDERFAALLTTLNDTLQVSSGHDFSHRDLASLTTSLAALRSDGALDRLWDTVENACTSPHLRFVAPRDMAQLVWAFGQCNRPSSARVVKTLLDTCVEEGTEFDPQGVAMLFQGSASTGLRHRAQRIYALQAAKCSFARYSARHCGNIIWAFAKVKAQCPGEITGAMATHVTKLDCGVIPATNMLWAFAKLHVAHIPLFEHLTREIMRQREDMRAREWSNVIWACATVNYTPHRAILSDIEATMVGNVTDAITVVVPQQMSNVLWSLAVLGVDDSLMDKLATRLAHDALAQVDSGDNNGVIQVCTPQALSNILWALATRARLGHPGLVVALMRECTARADAFAPPELANAAWSLSRLRAASHDDDLRSFFVAAAHHCDTSFVRYNAQSVSSLMYAMAKTLHLAPRSMLDAVVQSGPQWASYKTQELSVLAWSFATFYCSIGVAGMGKELLLRVAKNECAPVDVGQMLWAMAVTKNYDPEVFLPMFRYVEKVPKQHILLMECYTAALGFAVEHPAGPETMMDAILDAFPSFDEARTRLVAQKPTNTSMVHREVSRNLDQLGVKHEIEYGTSDGLFLDIALVDRRVALEIHGPAHYLTLLDSDKKVLEGSIRFKERLLRRRGWRVTHVSSAQFRQLRTTNGAECAMEFLKAHLEHDHVPDTHVINATMDVV